MIRNKITSLLPDGIAETTINKLKEGLDLVSRDEFEQQKSIIEKLRKKVALLEYEINKMQKENG